MRPLLDAFSQQNYLATTLAPTSIPARDDQFSDYSSYLGNQGYASSYDGSNSTRQYPDVVPYAPQPSSFNELRKRRISSISEPSTSPPRPSKKPSTHSLRLKDQTESYAYQDQRSGSYSPYVLSMTGINGYTPSFRTATSSPRPSMVQYPGLSGTPPLTMRAPSPLTPYTSFSSDMGNSGMPMSSGMLQQRSSTPPGASNPPLIRTSTLQQAGGLGGNVKAFNPYAIYPNKATLNLNGDLDSMARNWSEAERENRRRLVQFTRVQNGSTIHAEFQPVAPEDRSPSSICISCILWEEKNDCYVTSVDTIYLLQALVGVRFTVEEKNRIRRNLEGFRPLTISKTKPESENFFKVIMGFPAPKPRNIEKDVKVFPWKILAHSLKKIIGKYVCSVHLCSMLIK